MRRKIKQLLIAGFTVGMYLFFLIISLNFKIVWMNILLSTLWGSALIGSIYLAYRCKHLSRREKQRIRSQKPINHYYYDRWYTPADSTELDYQIEKIKQRKKTY